MSHRSFRGLLYALALAGALLDQGSKYGVFRWLGADGSQGEWVVVPGAFKLLVQYTPVAAPEGWRQPLQTWSSTLLPRVNHGALFGLGTEYEVYANAFFALVSVAAALAIIYWSFRPATKADGPLCVALGLILAGTLGNLYDRVVFGGVRDFLYFHWIEWPVFNVADCCLVCGAGLLLLQAFWAPAGQRPKASPAVEALPDRVLSTEY
jgi:lipoprotein signal peptidase